jgi:hypothetical protein
LIHRKEKNFLSTTMPLLALGHSIQQVPKALSPWVNIQSVKVTIHPNILLRFGMYRAPTGTSAYLQGLVIMHRGNFSLSFLTFMEEIYMFS